MAVVEIGMLHFVAVGVNPLMGVGVAVGVGFLVAKMLYPIAGVVEAALVQMMLEVLFLLLKLLVVTVTVEGFL